jgi:hypothetical protein
MKRATTTALFLLISVSAFSQLSKADTVVYDNTTSGLEMAFGWSGTVEFGDEVNLAGSARIGKRLEVLTYCSATNTTDTVLSLYDNTGIDGAPNNLLWTTDLGNLYYPAGIATLSADLPDILLPDTVTWTIKFNGYDWITCPLWLTLYDPPSVGSSSGDSYWYNWGGWCQGSVRDCPANFGAKITAAPEPSALILLGIAASGLLAYRRRRAA